MNAVATAVRYFDLSNKSDFDGIAQLLSDQTIYDSQNTGLHKGVNSIVRMQKSFHQQFSKLGWTINGIKETEPGVVIVDYSFQGIKTNGDLVENSGKESVVVKDGKIVQIEIRNTI